MTEKKRSNIVWTPNRREMLFIGLGGFVAAVPFARQRPLSLVRRQVLTMGTIAEFAVAHRDPAQAQAAIDAAIDALHAVDTSMSRFRPASDVGRANREAAGRHVPVGADTAAVVEAAVRWADSSGGAFDPCLGGAIELWDVTHRQAPPAAAESARFAGRRLFARLEVERAPGSAHLRFHDPDMRLDLGGIAKGYAVDRAVAALREHGVRHALVGAGGDVYALGRSPAGEAWRIGIQSPDDARGLAGTVRLEDEAIATSGDYHQYFVHGGRRYHHLLDPATGAPRTTRLRSVSVIAASCMDADAGATVAFVHPAATDILSSHGARVAHVIRG